MRRIERKQRATELANEPAKLRVARQTRRIVPTDSDPHAVALVRQAEGKATRGRGRVVDVVRDRQVPSDPFKALSRALKKLPTEGSRAWNERVAAVRTALDPQSGCGFLTISTADLFPPELADALFNALPHPGQADLQRGQKTKHGSNDWETMTKSELAPFRTYSDWVKRLMNAALKPDKPFEESVMQLRQFSGRVADDPSSVAFRDWHVDGGRFAVLITIKGTGTSVLPGTPKFDHFSDVRGWAKEHAQGGGSATPTGDTLIFSGTQRGKEYEHVVPTVHSSPLIDEDRLLFLIRLD